MDKATINSRARDLQVRSDVIDSNGLMKVGAIDVDSVAENVLELRIEAADNVSGVVLPGRTLAMIDTPDRTIYLHPEVLEGNNELKYRLILSHEIAHYILHTDHTSQLNFTFEDYDIYKSNGFLNYSVSTSKPIEREANLFVYFFIAPEAELRRLLLPLFYLYYDDPLHRSYAATHEHFKQSWENLRQRAIQLIVDRFDVSAPIAQHIMEVWGVWDSPKIDWLTTKSGGRLKTSL